MQFNNFLILTQKLEEISSICLENGFDWARGISLPDINLGLPNLEKKSKILMISDKTNPIYVQLEDGSKLFFTYDEFRRIQGKPYVGKTMHLAMQRLGNDSSKYPSKITMCKVI